jgi:type IV pilus assembly protein PilE
MGYTLIELMVVVIIIGVLAALAYPSYLNYVQQARRSDAEGALMSAAAFMERKYTENNSYDSVTIPNEMSTDYYTISLAHQSAQAFTLQAKPIGAQSADSCGTLSVSSTGIKLPSNCW